MPMAKPTRRAVRSSTLPPPDGAARRPSTRSRPGRIGKAAAAIQIEADARFRVASHLPAPPMKAAAIPVARIGSTDAARATRSMTRPPAPTSAIDRTNRVGTPLWRSECGARDRRGDCLGRDRERLERRQLELDRRSPERGNAQPDADPDPDRRSEQECLRDASRPGNDRAVDEVSHPRGQRATGQEDHDRAGNRDRRAVGQPEREHAHDDHDGDGRTDHVAEECRKSDACEPGKRRVSPRSSPALPRPPPPDRLRTGPSCRRSRRRPPATSPTLGTAARRPRGARPRPALRQRSSGSRRAAARAPPTPPAERSRQRCAGPREGG